MLLENAYDSVLLMAYGAPEKMEDVPPFHETLLRGLPVPKERIETVVHHLVFTTRSIPTATAERCPYVQQIETACRHVASRLGEIKWELAWQSRSGNPRTAWLEPDVNDRLHELKARRN